MPYLRSGKNIVNEPIKKNKKQPIEEVQVKEEVKEAEAEPIPVITEVSLEITAEPTTVLDEESEVNQSTADVSSLSAFRQCQNEVNKDIVKEVEEFVEIKDVPVLNKKKGYGCIIC